MSDASTNEALLPIRREPPAVDPQAASSAAGYLVEDNDLRAAANVALVLGKPLLLTGEAGVGKTEFARWLARELGGVPLHKFVVKSTPDARDLFYYYDALARFHDAQTSQFTANGTDLATAPVPTPEATGQRAPPADPRRFIDYNALGLGILFSLGRQALIDRHILSGDESDPLFQQIPENSTRTVVLIDEIDKAPRDVPNDILDEIDRQAFSVRELPGAKEAVADHQHRPVVVLTSNSERDLPKPFLRRCIYYHMQFPSENALQRIATERVGARFAGSESVLGEALCFFRHLRTEVGLNQPPGLAEMLDWLYALADMAPGPLTGLAAHPRFVDATRAALLKDLRDQERLGTEAENWLTASLAAREGQSGGLGGDRVGGQAD